MPEIVNTSAIKLSNSEDGFFGKRPDDEGRPSVITVENISMVFNMASERLDNLKEYALKIIKRQLFFEEFVALDNISLEVKKGDVFGIIGTNGSGKSTLLKIVAGVLEPTQGKVTINGTIAPLIELGAGFDMDLSARENIYLNGALLGYSKQLIDEHFDEIVTFAEIERFLDMPLKNYSSGMVARIAFAIATVIVPDILIVDEVLSVGDFMFQKKCEARISELIEQHGVTVLIVSHSNDQIARLCNKVIWIEKGHKRLLGEGTQVCRIYDALGGRIGSSDSEKAIMDALTANCKQDKHKTPMIISAASSSEMGVKLAERVEQSDKSVSSNSCVLATDSTHLNAVVANALAASMHAPILPLNRDHLSVDLKYWLEKNKPSEVIVFDCSKLDNPALEELRALSFSPNVVRIGSTGDVHAFSLEAFAYGSERGFWNDTVAIASLNDNRECLCASPYLYNKAIPLIVQCEKYNNSQEICNILSQSNIQYAIAFGQDAPILEPLTKALASAGINVTSVGKTEMSSRTTLDSESCLAITQFVFNAFSEQHPVKEIQIGNFAMSVWPDLQTCGYYGSSMQAPLLLCDDTNLDSIAASLRFIQDSEPITPLFIQGQVGLSPIEIELFTNAS